MTPLVITWARDEDADRLRDLLRGDGLDLQGGKWTGIGTTWLVARTPELSAAIAVHHGRPIARLDFLVIDRRIQGLLRVRVVKAIIEAAMAVVAQAGASFVTGLVSYDNPEFGEVLTSYGGRQINDGWLYVAALNEVLDNISHGRKQNHTNHQGHTDP